MTATAILASLALAWLVVSLAVMTWNLRRARELADALAARHPTVYEELGRPRPGFFESAQRTRFARFVGRGEFEDLDDPPLIEAFASHRRREAILIIGIVAIGAVLALFTRVVDPVRSRFLGLPLVALLFLGILGLPNAAQSCSCAPLEDPVTRASEVEAVFIGRAGKTEDWFSFVRRKTRFEVTEALAGEPLERMTIWTGKSGAVCGTSFEVGANYLIFARREDGRWSTNLCSSFRISDELEPALGALRSARDASHSESRRRTIEPPR